MDWVSGAEAAIARYRDGERRLDGAAGPDERQRQLTRLGNVAWAAGLCLLAAGMEDDAAAWLRRAAERYRASWAEAPPDSWGRPIAAIKALLLAGDEAAAVAGAALEAGAEAGSPIGRYAATLALLVLGEDARAEALAATLRGLDGFPPDVAGALRALAAGDGPAYAEAVRSVLGSFEERTEFLEDVPLADTVLVLQRLAAARGLAAELPASPRLPA